jgi:hypothetical protein
MQRFPYVIDYKPDTCIVNSSSFPQRAARCKQCRYSQRICGFLSVIVQPLTEERHARECADRVVVAYLIDIIVLQGR